MEEQTKGPDVNLDELYQGLASKLFKLKDNEWAEAKQSEDFNGEKFIENRFENLVTTFKTNEKEKIDKAVRRTAERKEREFYESLGLKYEGQTGEDYFATIKENLGKKSNNDTDLKNKYNELIREKSEWLKQLELKEQEVEKRVTDKFNNIIQTQKKGERVSSYVDKNVLSRKDLAFTEDSEVNAYRIGLLKKALLELNTNIKEDGTIELLDDNGELLRNSKHHVVTFSEVANDLVRKTIGVSKSSPKQSTGITSGNASVKPTATADNLQDFNKVYKELVDQGKHEEAKVFFQEFSIKQKNLK